MQNKIDAVVTARVLDDITQLHSFIGFLNYYARFLPNLISVLHPLYNLQKRYGFSLGQKLSKSFRFLNQVQKDSNADDMSRLPRKSSRLTNVKYGLDIFEINQIKRTDTETLHLAVETKRDAELNFIVQCLGKGKKYR